MKQFLFFLLVLGIVTLLSLGNISFPSQKVYAAACQGIVTDQAGTRLAGVSVNVYTGDDVATGRNASKTFTTTDEGAYTFEAGAAGYGYAAASTARITFVKEGYNGKIFDPATSCPGNVTLTADGQVTNNGFVCYQGTCNTLGTNPPEGKHYTDESSCSADCGKFTIANNCTYDANLSSTTTGIFFSKQECLTAQTQANITPGQTQLYYYSLTNNTCNLVPPGGIPRVTGVPKEECEKQLRKVDVKTVTPTFPPPTPLCAELVNGKCQAVHTALGIIETDPTIFIKRLFAILLSLAGGIALALIIFSGYKIMTSQGNEEAVKGAKETITSAVVGLLFMIFSLVLLQIIGVDILGIPGLQ